MSWGYPIAVQVLLGAVPKTGFDKCLDHLLVLHTSRLLLLELSIALSLLWYREVMLVEMFTGLWPCEESSKC